MPECESFKMDASVIELLVSFYLLRLTSSYTLRMRVYTRTENEASLITYTPSEMLW